MKEDAKSSTYNLPITISCKVRTGSLQSREPMDYNEYEWALVQIFPYNWGTRSPASVSTGIAPSHPLLLLGHLSSFHPEEWQTGVNEHVFSLTAGKSGYAEMQHTAAFAANSLENKGFKQVHNFLDNWRTGSQTSLVTGTAPSHPLLLLGHLSSCHPEEWQTGVNEHIFSPTAAKSGYAERQHMAAYAANSLENRASKQVYIFPNNWRTGSQANVSSGTAPSHPLLLLGHLSSFHPEEWQTGVNEHVFSLTAGKSGYAEMQHTAAFAANSLENKGFKQVHNFLDTWRAGSQASLVTGAAPSHPLLLLGHLSSCHPEEWQPGVNKHNFSPTAGKSGYAEMQHNGSICSQLTGKQGFKHSENYRKANWNKRMTH